MYHRFREWLYAWFGIHWWRYYFSADNPLEIELEMRECRLSERTQVYVWGGGICCEPQWDDVEFYE